MPKRVEIETTITSINKDQEIKPTAPYYKFINTGNLFVIMNDNFLLYPAFEFGVNNLKVAAKLSESGIPFEGKTNYKFVFGISSVFGLNQIHLIQTKIKVLQ